MKNLLGCLLILALLYVAAVVIYFLFNILLYFLPLLVVAAIILALPSIWHICFGKDSKDKYVYNFSAIRNATC